MSNSVLDAVPTYVASLIQNDFIGDKKNAIVESNILLGSPAQAVQPQGTSGKIFSYTFQQPINEHTTKTRDILHGTEKKRVAQVTVKNLIGFYGVVININNFERLKTKTYLSPLVAGDYGTCLLSVGGDARGVVQHERITHTQQVIINPSVCSCLVRAGNSMRPRESIVYQARNYALQAVDIIWSNEGTSAQVSFLPVWEWWSVTYPATNTKTCYEKAQEYLLIHGTDNSPYIPDPTPDDPYRQYKDFVRAVCNNNDSLDEEPTIYTERVYDSYSSDS